MMNWNKTVLFKNFRGFMDEKFMAKSRRPLAADYEPKEVDNNMTDGVKPRGSNKSLDFFSPDEACFRNTPFIHDGEVVMLGHDGKELTFDMS